MPNRRIPRQEAGTSPLIWAFAILCTILTIAVIIVGIGVFFVYLIYHPKVPRLRVADGHLNTLDYDQSGLLSTEIALTIVAENDNKKADTSIYDTAIVLRFHSIRIAELRAAPFNVPKNTSLPLTYLVPSSPIPLDQGGMDAMDAALKQGIVPFDLSGQARTRWKVGILLSVKFWTHLSCQLKFFLPNGTVADFGGCSSRTH